MTDSSQDGIYEKLLHKFTIDVADQLHNEGAKFHWIESSNPKLLARKTTADILRLADVQLDLEHQIQLLEQIAAVYVDANLYDLARENLEIIIAKQEGLSSRYQASIIHVQALIRSVTVLHDELIAIKCHRIAPIGISKLLLCLKDLRSALDIIFDNTPREQEQLAWLVNNLCKLIYNIGQSLLWISCGKYVVETMIYAAICMESIINLCTSRHMKLRMKLYSTAFYALLTQGTSDEAAAILFHATTQFKELKEREELDPPVPVRIQAVLTECAMDLSTMQCALQFWKDPDSLDITSAGLEKFKFPTDINPDLPAESRKWLLSKTNAERCLCECIRIQHLTSGNTNEPWKKRSGAISRAFWKYFQSKITSNSTSPRDPSSDKNDIGLTIQCMLEIATIAMFDVIDESVPTDELLKQIWLFISQINDFQSRLGEEEAMKELVIFNLLSSLIQTSDEAKSLEIALQLFNALTEFLYTPQATRRQAMLRRVAVALWSRFIYPRIQSALTMVPSTNAQVTLEAIQPALIITSKILETTFIEDPVLLGSVAVITGAVMKHLGDYRGAISLLRQAVDTIEDHRAARVEIKLHLPEDARDISALQRISFTTRNEAQDWFHSVKRLGAHAFAGFGIFGAGSSADPTDQAIADIHCDLLTQYFRVEIEYSILQQRAKPNQNKNNNDTTTHKKSNNTENQYRVNTPHDAIRTDKLSCTGILKAYCNKNSYARAILSMELAMVESRMHEVLALVENAQQFIEESEAREKLLTDSFQDLTVLVEKEARHPIVLARSHRFIYVAPVGTRKQAGRASYYRILAKEQGAGTDISMTSTELAGSDHRVPVADMQSPSQAAVKIDYLRSGERYVFASVAFTDHDDLVGGISVNTPPVDSVNPLPTVTLWAKLTKTAFALNFDKIARASGVRVCDRFFLKPVRPPVMTIGEGFNIFLHEEPVLGMLALQQASVPVLIQFIETFLAIESPQLGDADTIGDRRLHWDIRRDSQVELLAVIRKSAVVATVAMHLQHHELIVKIVSMGYLHALRLLMYDELQMAAYLQNSLTSFVVALQSIPKRHWRDLEHNLYCMLLQHLVKGALLSKNIAPVVSLLSHVYDECEASNGIDEKARPSQVALANYFGLAHVVDNSMSIAKPPQFEKHMKVLFQEDTSLNSSPPPADESVSKLDVVGYFWKQTPAVRLGLLKGSATSLLLAGEPTASVDLKKIDGWLKDLPANISDFLRVLSALIKDMISAGKSSDVLKLVQRVPIYDKYLSPAAKQLWETWKLAFVQPLPPPQPPAPAAAAPAKGGKGAPPPVAAEPVAIEDIKQVPSRFENITTAEEQAQTKYLAEITALIANSCYTDNRRRNYFPVDNRGPRMSLNPNETKANELTFLSPPAEPSVDAVAPTTTVVPPYATAVTKSDFIRYQCAAIAIFSKMQYPFAATLCATKLWNFIVDEWETPKTFCEAYQENHRHVHTAVASLVSLLEAISGIPADQSHSLDIAPEEAQLLDATAFPTSEGNSLKNTVSFAVLEVDGVNTRRDRVFPKSIQELLYLSQELLIFLIKVVWLYQDYQDVVEIGSRILHMYMILSPEFCKAYGDGCNALMLHAQQQLVDAARGQMNHCKSELMAYINAYEEQQKKKRKKMRIARLEKDEEELRFEAGKALLDGKVEKAEAFLNMRETRMKQLEELVKHFDTFYATSVQMMDKVKKQSTLFLMDCELYLREQGMEQSRELLEGDMNKVDDPHLVAFMRCLNDPGLARRLEDSLFQYNNLANFLREKKDRITLLEALKEQGDLLLLFNRRKEARSCWYDAIDGLFNAIDACLHWQPLIAKYHNKEEVIDQKLLSSIPPAMVILGKLSNFSATNADIDSQVNYCKLAAAMCQLLFDESVAHPQHLVGFAAYVVGSDLGGIASLSTSFEKLTPVGFIRSLEEIVRVLYSDCSYMEVLPVVVLWEHYHAVYTRNIQNWLKARIARIEVLIAARLFAEAAAMIAGIRPGIVHISNHSTTAPFKTTAVDALTAGPAMNTESYDLRPSGLTFFGLSPFYNHLPIDHEDNKSAIAWIQMFPQEFQAFAGDVRFSYEVPLDSLSEEEKKDMEDKAAAAVAAAAEADKKGKGGKSSGKKSPRGEEAAAAAAGPAKPVRRLIDNHSYLEISLLCAQFVTELICAHHKPYSLLSASTYIKQLSDQADASVKTVLEAATTTGGKITSLATNSNFMTIFARCQMLKTRLLLRALKHKESRANLLTCLKLLQHSSLQELSSSVRSDVTQLWFFAKGILVDIAERQGRFDDGIALATQAAREASTVFAGYWLRAYLLKRAVIHMKLGHLKECVVDCDALMGQYDRLQLADYGLVRALTLKATIIRSQAMSESNPDQAILGLIQAIDLTRRARDIAEELARKKGFHGADANMTFNAATSVISEYHLLPQALHNITEVHANEPDLTLKAKVSTKKLIEVRGSTSIPAVEVPPSRQYDVVLAGQSLRNAPVDGNETTYSNSPLANIYLRETQFLAACHAALCTVLDELRLSNVFASSDTYELNDLIMDRNEILKEQTKQGENGLKVLRYNLHGSSYVRLSLLQSVGKCRFANATAGEFFLKQSI